MLRQLTRSLCLAAGLAALAAGGTALAQRTLLASTTVPATRLSVQTRPIGASDIAPPACAGMGLTGRVSGGGTLSAPTAANTLLIGSGWLWGGNGNDCLVGGFICVGGGGNDRFVDCLIALP